MGVVFGIIKRLLKSSFYFALFFAIIVFIPNLPPYAEFSSIELEPTQPREGTLAPNGALNNVQQLYKNKLLGPEAFQEFEGEVYTSLVTGELVKLSPGGHVTFVAKLGNPCTGLHEEAKCGRPLDFEINEKERKIIVADAYYGIWKVDIKTGSKQLLVSPHVEIAGKVPRLFNSIALDKNGDFFWSDSCSGFGLSDGAFCTLADPSGRLFHYNAAKNTSTVLIDKLWFANGVAVSPDRQFVVVAETARYRLMKHYLAGPKKGQTEVFIAGLPGTPDNVRVLPDGSGLLVGLYTVFDEEHPLLMRALASTPLARKFVARLLTLAELPFVVANKYFPHFIFQTAIYKIGNFASLAPLLPPMSGLVQLDWNGNVVTSYFNTDRSLKSVSDAIVFKDQLYLGAPYGHDFVGSIPAPELLKKAFSVKQAPKVQEVPNPKADTVRAKEEKPSQSKPASPTPKPTEAPKPVKPAQAKPAETKPRPKPAEVKPTPKPTEAKSTTPSAAKTTPKPAAAKAEETKPTPKPAPTKPVEAKTTPKPAAAKSTEAKPAAAKPAEAKPIKKESLENNDKRKTKKATEEPQKKKAQDKPAPEQIPIVEEIQSDTAKPSRDTLKVIKKDGPTEIPNPHL